MSQLPARATAATYTYCTFGTTSFKMDFYRPTGWGAVPVVLQVHGGGWVFGQRTHSVTAGLVSAFLKRGIAFATIDYQLWNGRSASNDVACAVRYLRASKTRLGLTGRVGAMGQSAGGHLVSLLGTTDNSAGFNIGQYPNQSSRVQAVADQFGPIAFNAYELATRPFLAEIFGSADLNVLQQFSPLTYVSADDPPFLVIHGVLDSVVLPSHSQKLATALRGAAVPVRVIWVKNARHYLSHVAGAPPLSPTFAQVQTELVTFFAGQLRK